MSKVAHGYAHLRIGNGDVIDAPNFAPCERVLEGYFLDTVIQKGPPHTGETYSSYATVGVMFARYGNLRYKKDSNLVIGHPNKYLYDDSNRPMYRYANRYVGYGPYTDFARRRNYSATASLATTDNPAALGSVTWYWTAGDTALPIGTAPYLPNSWYGFPALGFIDIPGTQIGLVYRHPAGRGQYFNEVGVVWTSQGSIEMSGAYTPPENLLQHRMYRVYYTKSGGCGKLESTPRLDTDGVVTTGSDNFNSAAVTFVAGDVGKYIAIRGASNAINNGTFLITTFVDAHNVTVDASTINQPFTTESGLGFEVREGPVGEYFVQSKPYLFGGYDYNTSWYWWYSTLPLQNMTHELRGAAYAYALPTSVVHDRGACWWWLTNTDYNNALGLLRWKHLCPEGVDPVYGDGDITNMPTGITKWRDMGIDADNKIWIGIDDSANTIGYSLFKIDPYPGGNARYPDCVTKVSAGASGLPSRNVRGVVCDNKNNRTWALCYSDGVNDGGLAYTEDGGATWSRVLVRAPAPLTGATRQKASGVIQAVTPLSKATGSITINPGQPNDGDYFTIGDGVTSVTFEFDDDSSVTPGRTPIDIGIPGVTLSNAQVAINASGLNIVANYPGSGYVLSLTHGLDGYAYNIAITKSGNFSVTGMSGGHILVPGDMFTINDGTALGDVNFYLSVNADGSPVPSTGNTGTDTVTFGAPNPSYYQQVDVPGATFTADSVGHHVHISGASSENNGLKLIVGYNSATSISVYNSAGISEVAPGVTWNERGDQNNWYVWNVTANTASALAAGIQQAINESDLDLSTVLAGTAVNVVYPDYGAQGNIPMTESIGDPELTVTGLDGGHAIEVASDGVTVTNPYGDSLFLTELQADDWISMFPYTGTVTKRQVASITDDNTLVLTAATAFPGAVDGVVGMQAVLGVLTSSQAALLLLNVPGTLGTSDDVPCNPPCDYDSSGRLYWIPADRDQILRIDLGSVDLPQSISRTSLPAYNSTTWEVGKLRSLTVMHMPESVDHPHPMQDFVWIGSYNSELALIHAAHDWSAVYTPPADVTITGIADLSGGVVRATTSADHGMTAGDTAYVNNTTSYNGKYTVLAATTNTFDFAHTFVASETGNLGSGRATITRYHRNVTPNNWPLKIDTGPAMGQCTCTRAVVDQSRGACWLVNQTGSTYVMATFVYTHPHSGAVYHPGTVVGWAGVSFWTTGGTHTVYHQLVNGDFADTDLGFYWCPGGGEMLTNSTEQAYAFHNGGWASWVWDGAAWGPATISVHSYSLDFSEAAGGPYINNKGAWAVGKGAKRCHEDRQPLQYGMSIRFVDAEGSVDQGDQFIVDETSTFGAYVGRGKGNIETASWAADTYRSPTVYREGTEPVVEAKNLWTVDGGVDGGFVDNASQSAFPVFTRGIAEYSAQHPAGVGGTYAATYYPNFSDERFNSHPNSQNMAALRIADDLELSADLSVGTTSDIVTSASRDFTAADEGKSIFVEGAVNAANNGQAVIKKANPSGSNAREAQVYKIYTVTEASLRWKLRNIPAVGYVALTTSFSYPSMATNMNFYLYSSSDHGQTWGSYIRRYGSIYGCAANAPNTIDTGVSIDTQTLNAVALGDSTGRPLTLIFDIRDLPEDVRRRQYWKITKTQGVADGQYYRMSSVLLYDDNMVLLGRPTANKVTDADDPLFVATLTNMTVVAYRDLAATISAVDDGDGDGYTDLLTVGGGGNLYEQSGVATGNVTTAGVFTSAGASFAPTDVGKILRIPDAQAVTGVGLPAWTGFSAIATVVDANTVNLSHTFVADYTNIDWALLAFGAGDRLFFDSPAVMDTNMSLRSFYPTVEDVISNTQIRVSSVDVPVGLSALPFHIWRYYPDGVSEFGPQYYNGYSTVRGLYDPVFGTLYYSDPVEFITLLDLTLNATTPVDDDGDGRTDVINLPSALPASVAVGDYITISHATYGRRVFEIKTIDGPRTQITVTYDEIFPSLTSISYYIHRRRNWKSHVKKAVTTCQEQI